MPPMKWWAYTDRLVAEGRVGPVPATIAVILCYCLLQIVVLPSLSALARTGVGIDDAEQLMYVPYFWAGYGGSQPPLYTWLGWLSANIVGTNVLSLILLKYTLMAVSLVAAFLLVRRQGCSKQAATAAALGFMLFPQFLWEMQHTLSHSVAAFCCAVLLLACFFELWRRPSPWLYAVLGMAMAAATLAKYNNLILIVSLLAAALSMRETRRVVASRWFLLSLAVALVALAPTLHWSFENQDAVLARTAKFGMDASGGVIERRLAGIWTLILSLIEFAALPLVVYAVIALLTRSEAATALPKTPPDAPHRLVWRTIAIAVGATLLLVLATGTTKVSNRWLLPALVYLPIAVAMSLDLYGVRGKTMLRGVAATGVAFAVLVLPATWMFQVYGGSSLGSSAQIRYAELHAALIKGGPVRSVVSDWHWIGNLRLVDPSLRVFTAEVPGFDRLLQEPVVLAWLDTDVPNQAIVERLRGAGFSAAEAPRTIRVSTLFGPDAGRRIGFQRLTRHDMSQDMNRPNVLVSDGAQ
jgi:hypothetical protein